jgi:hypothetical protein
VDSRPNNPAQSHSPENNRWIESKHRLTIALRQRRPATRVATWSAPLYPARAFHPNFRTWKKSRGAALAPLPPPAALAPLPGGVEAGLLPSLEEVRQLLGDALAAGIGDQAARRVLSQIALEAASDDVNAGSEVAGQRRPATARAAPFVAAFLDGLPADSTGGFVAGGAAAAPLASQPHTAAGGPLELKAIRSYLNAALSAPAVGTGLEFLRQAVNALEGPANAGGSFQALLGRPLVRLGRLSLRQVGRGVGWALLGFRGYGGLA